MLRAKHLARLIELDRFAARGMVRGWHLGCDWGLVIGVMDIFKRMSRTLTEVGPTLRLTLFRDEAAQASH